MNKSTLKNNTSGFTLIELLIVIAVLIILATIVAVLIDPTKIFINARNSQRAQDVNTIQIAMSKYLVDVPSVTVATRSLSFFPGYSTLYSNATGSLGGACPNGTTSLNSPVSGAFTIDQYSTSTSINISYLISKLYLPKVLSDPLNQTLYKACIDTANGNQLVIYSDQVEGNIKYPTAVVAGH